MINHDYHGVELQAYTLPDDVNTWLTDRFGPGDGTRWFFKSPTIYFVNNKDHMMFLLAWS